jgi:hypothetical protein
MSMRVSADDDEVALPVPNTTKEIRPLQRP